MLCLAYCYVVGGTVVCCILLKQCGLFDSPFVVWDGRVRPHVACSRPMFATTPVMDVRVGWFAAK